MLGLGSLGLERWGRALVLTVDGGPFGQQLDRLLGAVLEGALQRAFGRDCRAVKLGRDDRQGGLIATPPAPLAWRMARFRSARCALPA